MKTGIEPLDRRLGDLTPGRLHVLAGGPGSGRLVALFQFLAEGLEAGARVGLVGAIPPERLMEQSRHWGFRLEESWRDGRLRLLSFTPDFERRLLSAAEPEEVFAELGRLLGAMEGLERLGIHPGSPLWETRSGTNLASQFVGWTESLNATTWATLASDLEDTLTTATEWVLQAAAGLFHLERLPDGLHQLTVRRLSPPAAIGETITLEAVPGRGLVAPSARPGRRETDPAPGSEGRLAIVRLAPALPAELEAWAHSGHPNVVESKQAIELVERLQGGETFGLILVYLEGERIEAAVRACRVLGRLTEAPILVATEDRLRSGDRVRVLEAGARDILSAPLSLAELASRSQRVRVSGEGRGPAPGSGAPTGEAPGMLDEPFFTAAVRQRLAHPEWRIFTLVQLQPPAGMTERLLKALRSEVRDETGDLVGSLAGGFGVLLHGAEVQHAERFLRRVRKALGIEDVPLGVRIWSGLTDRETIDSLLTDGEAASPSVAS